MLPSTAIAGSVAAPRASPAWDAQPPRRRAAAAATALVLTSGGLLTLHLAPLRVLPEPEVIWLQWPSLREPRLEPEAATRTVATPPAARQERSPTPTPRRQPTAPTEPQAITIPAPASAPTSTLPAVAVAAAPLPPASAASAPPLRLRLEGPAGRAAAVASRSEVQLMAQRADTPLVHGQISGQERLANRIAETALPSCTDPVGGGLLALPWVVLRPLAGRCR